MPRNSRRAEYDDDPRPRRRKAKPAGNKGLLIGLVAGGAALLFLVCGGLAFAGWRYLSPRGDARPTTATETAARPVGRAKDEGFRIELNPPVRPELGGWQRLTPAGHPVTLMAPGTPEPSDPLKLKFLGGHTFKPSLGWQTRGSDRTLYFFVQTSIPRTTDPDKQPGVDAGSWYVANGSPTDSQGKVLIDGLPGEQFGPQKGWPISYRFVFRVLTVGNRVYVFGANTLPDDPAVVKFFDSFKLARGPDGQPIGPTPGSPVGMPGLTAYLSFDDDPAGGGPAIDAVSKKPVGTPVGAVGRAAGIRGQALDLTRGGSFQLTGLEAATTAKAGKPFTVALWFKSEAANGTVFLAGTPGKTPRFPHLELGLVQRATRAGDKQPALFVRRLPGPADKAREDHINTRAAPGEWMHLAFTREENGTATLYVNGEQHPGNVRTGMTGTIGGPTAILGGLNPVPRSEFAPASDPDPKERTPFAGLIDELALFDVALTEEQVRKLSGD